jgi:ABC-2 type transport system permease protein
MGTWWRGTAMVAERGLVQDLRSKTFKIVTGLLLLVSIAAVVVPQVLGDDGTTYTLATTGKAPAGMVAVLDTAGKSADFEVKYVTRADGEAVRRAVRDGDADAGLSGGTLYTKAREGGTFPVLVAQAAVGLETARQLSKAGLSPQQVTELQSVQPPKQVVIGQAENEGRAGVGYAAGIVLYMFLVFAGSVIGTNVAVEKSTRISEVLLAVLRPSQMIVGTVVAVGTVYFAQLLILVAPFAIAVQLTDRMGLPPVAAADIGLAVAWFLLGFLLFAFLYAAAAAMVDKVTEVGAAIMPITMILIVGYVLAITVVTTDPSGGWSVALSMFPFTAPMAMPVRWAAGQVPVWQLLLAMALTAATAVFLVAVASSIYRRALVITGRRVKLREVIAHRTAS